MSVWSDILDAVRAARAGAAAEGYPELFYRGQADASWSLRPGLARAAEQGRLDAIENNLYYEMLSLGGHLLDARLSTWDRLFVMQHHGFPTRLLDWTGSFLVAVHFALALKDKAAAVWILNPFKLNERTWNMNALAYLDTDFPAGYEAYFANSLPSNESFGKFPAAAVALVATSHAERMRAQRAVFTLHRDLDRPLEQAFPDCVQKIELPPDAREEALEALSLAGINEYSLFPDLDGLARHLRGVHL
jgi:hypothetical protein